MKTTHLAFATLALLVGLQTNLCAQTFYSAKPHQRIADWQLRMLEIGTELETRTDLASVQLVFLGDSITHYWLMAENPWVKGQRGGRAVWDDSFATPNSKNLALNMGVTGDRTEHLLFRLLPRKAGGLGELDKEELKPEFILVMIGINNTWASEEPVEDSVFAGAKAVVMAARKLKPQSKIIIESLLPSNDREKNRLVVQVVNARLEKLAASTGKGSLHFLDLYSSYVDAAGVQRGELFCDALHLNEAGYRVWRDRLVTYLAEIRSSKSR